MVRRPEEFHYNSHRAYVGLEQAGLVDAQPVLRHFGATRNAAVERFRLFVRAGMKLGHKDEFYRAKQGGYLGLKNSSQTLSIE